MRLAYGNDLLSYLLQGMGHIMSLDAVDHLVFLLALVAIYESRDWKRVAFLVTAFTAGHALAAIFGGFGIFSIPRAWADFLIPLTILITALRNIIKSDDRPRSRRPKVTFWMYLIVGFFGLIHGFGFVGYFALHAPESANVFVPLLLFNLGVEFSQIIVIILLLLLSFLIIGIFRIKHYYWTLVISGMAIGMSLLLLVDSWIF